MSSLIIGMKIIVGDLKNNHEKNHRTIIHYDSIDH